MMTGYLQPQLDGARRQYEIFEARDLPLPSEATNSAVGKATDAVDPDRVPIRKVLPDSHAFDNNCPLWTYILAEAALNQEVVKIPVEGDKSVTTPRLGPVGGRIVAEVFLGLMFSDKNSMLNLEPGWTPANPKFQLKDFVNYALGK